ncbi:MAG: hypothetical protein Q9167_005615 [Letrouitia subvulpina]
MAPIKSKTPSMRSAPKTSNHSPTLGTKSSKRDKRAIEHSALISRIEKPKAPSRKRRRPSGRSLAGLESLADALPEPAAARVFETPVDNAKIRHKSVKSRPGSLKKQEKLTQMEKERFNKNMAQMAASHNAATAEATAASGGHRLRWAAVRQFIQQTMEQRPDTSAEE